MYYILRKCQEGAKNLAFPACLVMIQEEVCMGSRVHVESRTGKAQQNDGGYLGFTGSGILRAFAYKYRDRQLSLCLYGSLLPNPGGMSPDFFSGKSFFQQRYHTEIFDDIVRSNWNWRSHFLWHCAAYEANVNWNQGAEWGGKGTMNILDLFQGIGTMFVQSPSIVIARIVLIFLGFLLVQSLLLSAIGGIVGGYVIYFLRKGNFNPTVGIAGVSCVPSTAKVAQKAVSKENPATIILDYALGANICGVITTAILTGIYITLLG